MLDDDAYLHWLDQCGFSDSARTLLTDIRRSSPARRVAGGRGNIHSRGTARLTGEDAQASLRGRPRGRLGIEGSGNGCLRGRLRGRFGAIGSQVAFLRGRPAGLGATQGRGAIL